MNTTTTIQTANGIELSYTDILDKQQRIKNKKKKARKQEKFINQYQLINQGNLPSLSRDELSLYKRNNRDKVQLSLQQSAQRVADQMIGFTPFEFERALSEMANKWIDEQSTNIEEEQVGPILAASIEAREIAENKRRRDAWIASNADNWATEHEEFYVVAHMPQIGVKYDTRKLMYVYDKKAKRPIRKTSRAYWDDPQATRFSIITKILKACDALPEMTGDRQQDALLRKQALKQALKERELTLSMSFVMTDCVHQANTLEFPMYLFSLHSTANSSTNYQYDKYTGNIVHTENDNGIIDKDDTPPLTMYELEDLIIKGRVNNPDNITNDSLSEAFNSKRAGNARNTELADLQMGIDSYVKLVRDMGRDDLVDLATDPECPECPMIPEIAQALWDGDMQPADAIVLWGDIYHQYDKHGNKIAKRGMWLREAMDILIVEGLIDPFKSKKKEDKKFLKQIDKLMLHFGKIALDNLYRKKLVYGKIALVRTPGDTIEINAFTTKEDKNKAIRHLGLKAFLPH